GLYLIFGRLLFDAYKRSKTYYGISNERAIIVVRSSPRILTCFPLPKLKEASFVAARDGSGTLYFGQQPATGVFVAPQGQWDECELPPAFEGIADVRNAFRTLREALRNCRT